MVPAFATHAYTIYIQHLLFSSITVNVTKNTTFNIVFIGDNIRVKLLVSIDGSPCKKNIWQRKGVCLDFHLSEIFLSSFNDLMTNIWSKIVENVISK